MRAKKLALVFLPILILGIFTGTFLFSVNTASAVGSIILLNEFSSNGSGEWVELVNTTGVDIDLTGWALTVTPWTGAGYGTPTDYPIGGMVPARGLLAIDGSGDNMRDAGARLDIKNSGASIVSTAIYGDAGGAQVTAPGSGQSAIATSSGAWSVTSTPSKGWFNYTLDSFDCNDPPPAGSGLPPSLNAIVACIPGITTNMASMSDASHATGLYFSTSTNGKIDYGSTVLNLTDQNTRALLETMGTSMQISGGKIGLNAASAPYMKTPTNDITVSFYNMKDLGYGDINFNSLIVKDDSGDVIPTSSVDFPSLNSMSWDPNANNGNFTFRSNHFSEYDMIPIVTEVTPVASPVSTTAPSYTFYTNVTGTAVYGGSCDGTASAPTVSGNNTVNLSVSGEGIYSDCTVTVTDGMGSSSTLLISSFQVDMTAPALSSTSASRVTFTTGTLNFTTDEEGTYYFLVYLAPKGSVLGGFPGKAKVKAQGTSITKGTGAVSVGDVSVNITGLSPSVGYNAFVIVEDAAGNISPVSKIPFATTIQNSIDEASSGDTIVVPAGTYEENIIINKQITLVGDVGDGNIGAGANAPVIMSAASNRNVDILADGVVIKGFVIDNNSYNYPAVRVAANVASVTIQNNEMRNGYSGVTIANGSHENTVTKNKIYGNSYGLFINNSESNIISYNEIATSSNNGVELPGNKNAGNNRFSHNNIHNNSGKGINFGNYLDTTSGNIIVDYNTIDSNGTAGIYIDNGTTGININHNTISNNGQYEATTGIHVLSAAGNSAHNNVISNDNVDVGVNNEDGDIFDATQNYWGEATGPYDSVNNTGGNTHSQVVGNVNYSPWYSSDSMGSLSGVPTVEGDNKSYALTEEFNVTSSGYSLIIPAGTTVTGTTAWDGSIHQPTVTTTLSSYPSQSGYSTTMGQMIEVGFPDGELILSNAAKLIFPGEHGKRIGYTRPGQSFTEITAACGDNSQTWADANLGPEGDCKIDSGDDLVVWTKHFTSFATYTQTSSGGGGSGGNAMPYNVPKAQVVTEVSATTVPVVPTTGTVTVAGSNPGSGINFSGFGPTTLQPGSKIKFTYSYANNGEKTIKVKVVRQTLNAKGKAVKTSSAYRTLKPGASFTSNINEQLSGLLPAGKYTMVVKIYNSKNVKIDENSFSFILQKKAFVLGSVQSSSADIAFDAAAFAKIKSGVYLPVNFKVKYSYTNSTDKYHVVKMVRELVSGSGKVLSTHSSKWTMKVGEKDNSTFTFSAAGNLWPDNYQVRIRAYDWTTKELLAENALGFSVELK